MSNKAVIEQRTVITEHNQEASQEVLVMDDNHQDSIDLDDYARKTKSFKYFFEDPMELLLFVIKTAKKEQLDAINEILRYAKDHQNGIEIDGTFYSWEKIEPVFKKAKY